MYVWFLLAWYLVFSYRIFNIRKLIYEYSVLTKFDKSCQHHHWCQSPSEQAKFSPWIPSLSSFSVQYFLELVSENWDFYFIANFKFNFMKLSEEQCNMKYPVTWTEFRATLPFSRNWERAQILLDFFPFHLNAVFPLTLKPGMSWVLSKYKSHPPPPPSYGLSPW